MQVQPEGDLVKVGYSMGFNGRGTYYYADAAGMMWKRDRARFDGPISHPQPVIDINKRHLRRNEWRSPGHAQSGS